MIEPLYLPTEVTHPIVRPKPPPKPAVRRPVPGTVVAAPPAAPEVILVAGAGYPHTRGKIRDSFGAYCRTIAPRLHRKYPAGKITVFNVYAGTQAEYRFNGKRLVKPVTIKKMGQLRQAHYRYVVDEGDDAKETYVVRSPAPDDSTIYFPGMSSIHATDDVRRADYLKAFRDKRLREASLSVGDIYRYIEALGNSAKGTLVELHIFSHAWMGGPILANTKEYWELALPGTSWQLVDASKFLDKDGRQTDFEARFKVIKNPSAFKAAFAAKGFSMVWGCNWYYSPRQIINQVRRSPHYKDMLRKPADKLLELRFNAAEWGEETEAEFHRLVQDPPALTSGGKSDRKSLEDIKRILKGILDRTYMKKMASGTGRDVIGALPGTYANVDQTYQKQFGALLMHVGLGKPYKDYQDNKDLTKGFIDFRPILKFYSDHLGVGFKPNGEYDKKTYGRGYAVYRP